MRPLILATAFVLAVPAVAPAQQTPPNGVPQAPVGHRQPTAADVPANDSAKGGNPGAAPGAGPERSEADRKVDKMINVCPSC